MNEIVEAIETKDKLKLALEARGIDDATWRAISNSVFPTGSTQSKLLAWDYCKARKLDVMKKPCHIVPMPFRDPQTDQYTWRDVIMPGIAEHRITAARTGEYAGQDAPVFGDIVKLKMGGKFFEVPEYCSVTVYRIVKGHISPFTHTEWYEEACATKKDGTPNAMWLRRKRGQLAKCAEAGALRKACPEELGGIYAAEEMEGRVIEHDEFQAELPKVPVKNYTEEQSAEYKRCVDEDDYFNLIALQKTLCAEGQTQLYDLHVPKPERGMIGKKTKERQDKIEDAKNQLEAAIDSIKIHLSEENYSAVSEVMECCSQWTHNYIMSRLTAQEQTQISDLAA